MVSLALCGLESKPKLNGRTVSLLEYHSARKRWEVEIPGELPNEDVFKIEWNDDWHKPLEDERTENDAYKPFSPDGDPANPTFAEALDTSIAKHKVVLPLKDLIVLDCNLRKIDIVDQDGSVLEELAEKHIEHAWRKSFPLLFQKAPTGEKTLGVRPACLRIREEDHVEKLRVRKVEMVVNAAHIKPDLDGQFAKLRPFQALAARWAACPDERRLWDVKSCGSPCPVLMRSAELRDESSGKQLRDPFRVGPWATVEGQKALYANSDFKKGQVILEETPVLSAAEGDHRVLFRLLHQFQRMPAEQVKILLELPRGPQNLWRLWGLSQDKRAEMKRKDLDDFQEFAEMSNDVRDQAWDMLRVFDHCCFRHADAEGWLLYLTLALANHSCRPNAILADIKVDISKYGPDSFDRHHKVLIAQRDILEGEEITISYVPELDLLESLARRQQRLSRWAFKCLCQRCADDESKDPLRSFCCTGGTSCQGTHAASSTCVCPCSVCGNEVSVTDAERILCEENMHVSAFLGFTRTLSPEKPLTSPDALVDILEVAAHSGLAADHWVVCKAHDILAGFYQKCQQQSLAAENLEPILGLQHRVLGYHDWRRLETLADNYAQLGRFSEAFGKYSTALAAWKWTSPEEPESKSADCDRLRQKLRNMVLGKQD